ncbi:ketopantoate reductase PanE/ApbA C-terminal domain protein [Leptospira ryugenii]|uniref:2-dehydropantoate 2-reductase n=1 Tax=Leptospira ryugenii TaxID=1917863 RepID=A0A2P2DZ65_9LEPT|nr:ketopantoate reductase C-terminal domain-containing protein [Leptospira ryugenii]GBF49919.1 ketopantoate reductase PanE/ApbA C-terminal domain protein [Leptospira ryugenii]
MSVGIKQNHTIAIYGLGAISLTIARAFDKNGIGFVILARNQSRKNQISSQTFLYQFRTKPIESFQWKETVRTLDECEEKFDCIFIGCKSSELENYCRNASPLLKENGRLVLLQNGLPENLVQAKKENLMGGVVGWNTQKRQDGVYFQSNAGHLILGNSEGTRPDSDWTEYLAPFIPTILTSDLEGYRWHKLGINAIINGLAGSVQSSLGYLFLSSLGRKLAIAVLTEISQIMQKLGIQERVVPGSISIQKLSNGPSGFPTFIKHIVLLVLGIKYFKIRTSLVQDLDAKRVTEIDYLNAVVSKIGKTLQIPCPINDRIVEEIKDIESGKKKPDFSFLNQLEKSLNRK